MSDREAAQPPASEDADTRMAELLAKIAKDADPDGTPFFTDKRVRVFGRRAARAEGTPREIDLRTDAPR